MKYNVTTIAKADLQDNREIAFNHDGKDESQGSREAIAEVATLEEFYNSPEVPQDPDIRKRLRRKILKNVLLIGVAFFFHYVAYNGLANLQSSLHIDQGMGTVTQAVIYASMIVSSLFLPKLMISALGHKWVLPICMACYLLWMAANGYAIWATMIPSSIIVGLVASPFWTAKSSYLTKVAPMYAELGGERREAVVSRFIGIFYFFFESSGIVSSVISFTVLSPKNPSANETLSPEEVQLYCGPNDCPWNNVTNPNLEEPPSKTLWTLVGVYIAMTCIAVAVVSVGLDELPVYLRDDKSKLRQEACGMIVKTISHLKHLEQCLLIPGSIYCGFQQAFYLAEFNKSFISCSLGIWMVGLLAIPSYVVRSLTSLACGRLVKYWGCAPILTAGYLFTAMIMLILLLWPLDPDKEYIFYMLSTALGITGGIMQAQFEALHGMIFGSKSEAAFSNYFLWQSIGFIVPLSYSSFVCTEVKIYVVLATMVAGMVGYYALELVQRQKTRRRQKQQQWTKEVVDVRDSSRSTAEHIQQSQDTSSIGKLDEYVSNWDFRFTDVDQGIIAKVDSIDTWL